MPIAYNFAELQELSGSIIKAQQEVTNIKGDVRSSSSTLAAEWSGSASESWGQVQARWNTACDNLSQALTDLSKAVQSASDDMASTENENTKLFN